MQIVFWLGIFHNMCVLPVVFYLRSNTVYRERYVPLMSKSVQAMVERDALGEDCTTVKSCIKAAASTTFMVIFCRFLL